LVLLDFSDQLCGRHFCIIELHHIKKVSEALCYTNFAFFPQSPALRGAGKNIYMIHQRSLHHVSTFKQ